MNTAPVNIALIKYWGKRDVVRNIPMNDSLSVTLYADGLSAMRLETETEIEPSDYDSLVLNGVSMEMTERMKKCLAHIRNGHNLPPILIRSTNHFPTGAGLASSASGYAAFAKAIGARLHLGEEEICELARIGSGSACRSLYDGFVHWDVNGGVVKTIYGQDHWPELKCLVVVLANQEKSISSSKGMQRTVETSSLYQRRLDEIPSKISKIRAAIAHRDFGAFAEIVMRESNQLHAMCLDSYAPIRYLNDQSWAVIDTVHRLNGKHLIAAYTFDAGPNAFVFCLDQDRQTVLDALSQLNPLNIISCTIQH